MVAKIDGVGNLGFLVDKMSGNGTIYSTFLLRIGSFQKRRGSSVVEHVPEEHSVDGSIPSPGTIFFKLFHS